MVQNALQSRMFRRLSHGFGVFGVNNSNICTVQSALSLRCSHRSPMSFGWQQVNQHQQSTCHLHGQNLGHNNLSTDTNVVNTCISLLYLSLSISLSHSPSLFGTWQHFFVFNNLKNLSVSAQLELRNARAKGHASFLITTNKNTLAHSTPTEESSNA